MFDIFRVYNNWIVDLLGERDSDPSDISDEDVYNVVIKPPDEDAFAASDEDSDGSDGEAVGMIEHLPRSILRSTDQIH